MSIDSFTTDGLNIKDMVITEPIKKPELPFDPERDIRAEDWENMIKIIKSKTSPETGLNERTARELAARMHLLKNDEPVQQELLSRSVFRPNSPSAFTTDIAYHKLIFPDEPIAPELLNDDSLHSTITFLTHPGFGAGFDVMAYHSVFELFILRPDKLSELKKWGQGYVSDNFERYIQEFNSTETPDSKQIKNAVSFKLFFPEKAGMINISETKWKNIKKNLDEKKGDGYYTDFAEHALDLKILAAEKVEMTSEGMKFTMPKTQNNIDLAAESVPNVRKF